MTEAEFEAGMERLLSSYFGKHYPDGLPDDEPQAAQAAREFQDWLKVTHPAMWERFEARTKRAVEAEMLAEFERQLAEELAAGRMASVCVPRAGGGLEIL